MDDGGAAVAARIVRRAQELELQLAADAEALARAGQPVLEAAEPVDARRHSDSVTAGIHGLGGLEYRLPSPRQRFSVGGELQIQFLGAPDDPGGDGSTGVVHVAGFLKYRL